MRRVPLGLLLFLVFQGLYGLCASGRVSRVPDEYEVYFQTQSLWERGELALPAWIGQGGAFFGREGRNHELYAPYGPGAAFAALPHHLLGRALAAAAGLDPDQQRPVWLEVVGAVTSLATSTWAALAVLGTFLAALGLGATPGRAAWTAGALGVASLLFPYGTLFFSEPVSAALLIGAVALHLRGRAWLAAPLLTALLLIKATNVILAPALLALALWQPRRERRFPDVLAYGVALSAAVLIHLAWNRHRFGDPLQFGYDWSETIHGTPRPFALSRLPRGLFGLLLSPGKSLLLFAPPLLLAWAPARLRALGRRRPDVLVCGGLALGTCLLVFGSYMFWEGGYCPGPRHLVPLLPLLILPLALGPAPRPWAARTCLVLGAALGLLLTSVSYLEDQSLGQGALHGQPREVYYRIDPHPPPGSPQNVYRLDYSPLWTCPPLLWHYLRHDSTQVGLGLSFLRAHLLRVRAEYPGGGAIPVWLPWLLSLPFLLPLGLGLSGIRSRTIGRVGAG